MSKASAGRGPGIVLAITIGGPAVLGWAVWSFFVGTLVYSAIVATGQSV